MNPDILIIILGAAVAMVSAQCLFLLVLLRAERKFTKDLLTRLASRTVCEYAAAARALEAGPGDGESKTEGEHGVQIW